VIPIETDCEPDRPTGAATDQVRVNDLLNLYATAVSHYERALAAVEEMIAAVQNGADCEAQSVALRTFCGEIARLETRILAANHELSWGSSAARDLLMGAAQRHLTALSQLCDKVRAAEHAAAQRLLSLSPRLDASNRGKAMVSAYCQHRVS
jgi:hypothetical protein